jgi:hypothetical protein
MLHEIFDIDEWRKKLPLELIYASDPELFSGSWSITSLAQLRAPLATREQLPVFRDTPSVPTDIFVFGLGEPAIPYLTKVGGVPFRPANKPWAEHEGRKMTFLAQFCFSDSLDLFSFSLPGNLLEIFIIDYPPIERDFSFHYEWYNWEEVDKPMTLNDVPTEALLRANFENNVQSWHCVKYRTVDYPQASSLAMKHPDMEAVYDARYGLSEGYNVKTNTGGEFDRFVPCRDDLLWLAVLVGTKIGGTDPYFFGKTIHNEYGSDMVRDKNNHFLCSLTSISPELKKPYPFVNHPAPIQSEEYDIYSLLIDDVSRFHFYVSNQGEMLWLWSH